MDYGWINQKIFRYKINNIKNFIFNLTYAYLKFIFKIYNYLHLFI